MYAFIGGTPAAGKTHIAKQFIKKSGLPIEYISIDALREEFAKDPKLDYWVKFFLNQDAVQYWDTITQEQHLQNLIKQSEAFWPGILQKVEEVKKNHQHAIFEGVNLLPHLAHKDFDFHGLFLIEENGDLLFEKLHKEPRWGETEELQKLEAKFFVEWEARYIKEEAKKYSYKVFSNSQEAEKELENIFNKQLI